LDLDGDTMAGFRFRDWLIVEVFMDKGYVGIGNAALSPRVTKQVIDVYLKPLLIGKDPFDTEFLWQRMYRQTMAFGREGIGMVAISAVVQSISRSGICWVKPLDSRFFAFWEAGRRGAFRFMPAAYTANPWRNWPQKRTVTRIKGIPR
jgi:hypothetical protein